MRNHNVLLPIALALALAAAWPAVAGPEPGDLAPPLTATDAGKWVNTPAPIKLADQQGKVVALYFMQTTAPEMVKYALMYEDFVRNKYKDKGLVVIGISREKHDVLMNWCDENKITFPMCQDAHAWEHEYSITGYPIVYVIGIYGEVVYHGDGNEVGLLKPELERALAEVKRINVPRDQTSKAFDKVWRAIDKNEFPNAIKFLQAIVAGQDETDQLHATGILNDLGSIADARVKRAGDLEKRFDYLQAEMILHGVEKAFVGLDQSKAAKETLTRFEKDANIQRELKSQRIFEDGRAKEEKKDYQRAGETFAICASMTGTHAAPKAQMHINDLIKRKLFRP
jgi:peroxiredoxin